MIDLVEIASHRGDWREMEANGEEEAASSLDRANAGWDPQSDNRGKHRISVELKRLEQEARFLEVYFSFSYLNIFQFSSFLVSLCVTYVSCIALFIIGMI